MAKPRLKRSMGLWMATALVVGNMVGSGILTLPAVLELRALQFAAGSMRPKVEAACRFVELTGRTASIGALADLRAIVAGTTGTQVVPAPVALVAGR